MGGEGLAVDAEVVLGLDEPDEFAGYGLTRVEELEE